MLTDVTGFESLPVMMKTDASLSPEPVGLKWTVTSQWAPGSSCWPVQPSAVAKKTSGRPVTTRSSPTPSGKSPVFESVRRWARSVPTVTAPKGSWPGVAVRCGPASSVTSSGTTTGVASPSFWISRFA